MGYIRYCQKKDIFKRIQKSNHWLRTLRLTQKLEENETLLSEEKKPRKQRGEKRQLVE